MICEICGAPRVSRVTERFPDGRPLAGIVCCSFDPWHVDEGIDRKAWAALLALAEAGGILNEIDVEAVARIE